MLSKLAVGEKVMAGEAKWVQLSIHSLATTLIMHAVPPEEAIKVGEEMIAKAKELQAYNTALEDAKWEHNQPCEPE